MDFFTRNENINILGGKNKAGAEAKSSNQSHDEEMNSKMGRFKKFMRNARAVIREIGSVMKEVCDAVRPIVELAAEAAGSLLKYAAFSRAWRYAYAR